MNKKRNNDLNINSLNKTVINGNYGQNERILTEDKSCPQIKAKSLDVSLEDVLNCQESPILL